MAATASAAAAAAAADGGSSVAEMVATLKLEGGAAAPRSFDAFVRRARTVMEAAALQVDALLQLAGPTAAEDERHRRLLGALDDAGADGVADAVDALRQMEIALASVRLGEVSTAADLARLLQLEAEVTAAARGAGAALAACPPAAALVCAPLLAAQARGSGDRAGSMSSAASSSFDSGATTPLAVAAGAMAPRLPTTTGQSATLPPISALRGVAPLGSARGLGGADAAGSPTAAAAAAHAAVTAALAATPYGTHAARCLSVVGGISAKRALERRGAALTGAAVAAMNARVHAAKRDITLLQDELARKRRMQDRKRGEMMAALEGVRAEIASMSAMSDAEFLRTGTVRSDTLAKTSADHAAATADLDAELARLRTEYANLRKANAEAAATQRMRTMRASLAAEAGATEYTTSAGAKITEVEELCSAIAADAPALAEFEEYYAKVRHHLVNFCGQPFPHRVLTCLLHPNPTRAGGRGD